MTAFVSREKLPGLQWHSLASLHASRWKSSFPFSWRSFTRFPVNGVAMSNIQWCIWKDTPLKDPKTSEKLWSMWRFDRHFQMNDLLVTQLPSSCVKTLSWRNAVLLCAHSLRCRTGGRDRFETMFCPQGWGISQDLLCKGGVYQFKCPKGGWS